MAGDESTLEDDFAGAYRLFSSVSDGLLGGVNPDMVENLRSLLKGANQIDLYKMGLENAKNSFPPEENVQYLDSAIAAIERTNNPREATEIYYENAVKARDGLRQFFPGMKPSIYLLKNEDSSRPAQEPSGPDPQPDPGTSPPPAPASQPVAESTTPAVSTPDSAPTPGPDDSHGDDASLYTHLTIDAILEKYKIFKDVLGKLECDYAYVDQARCKIKKDYKPNDNTFQANEEYQKILKKYSKTISEKTGIEQEQKPPSSDEPARIEMIEKLNKQYNELSDENKGTPQGTLMKGALDAFDSEDYIKAIGYMQDLNQENLQRGAQINQSLVQDANSKLEALAAERDSLQAKCGRLEQKLAEGSSDGGKSGGKKGKVKKSIEITVDDIFGDYLPMYKLIKEYDNHTTHEQGQNIAQNIRDLIETDVDKYGDFVSEFASRAVQAYESGDQEGTTRWKLLTDYFLFSLDDEQTRYNLLGISADEYIGHQLVHPDLFPTIKRDREADDANTNQPVQDNSSDETSNGNSDATNETPTQEGTAQNPEPTSDTSQEGTPASAATS